MHWHFLVIIAVLMTTAFSLFIKLSYQKIDPLFGTVIVQLVALLVIAGVLFVQRMRAESDIFWTVNGIIYSALAGAVIVFANLCIFYIYNSNAPLSLVMPLMRIGGMVIIILVGLVFFKEQLDLQKVIGLLMSTVGIYLLIR